MKKKIFRILVFAIPLVLITWALTAKEYNTNIPWGCIITMMDKGSAKLYGLEKPGTYVGTRNGNAVTAVRGGLKLIISFQNPKLGMRAVSSKMFSSGNGLILTGSLVLWIISIILLFFPRKKKEEKSKSQAP